MEVDFRNTGSIDVRAGVLSLNAGGSVASGTAVHIEAGAMLRFAAGNFSLGAVTITGAGTLQVAGSASNTTSVVQAGVTTLAGELRRSAAPCSPTARSAWQPTDKPPPMPG